MRVPNSFLAALSERVLVADGAMGTMLQAADLTLDDFQGHEGCNEILNVTRPDVVRGVHEAYLAAGADCVETNTFGANLGNLGDYDIQDRIFELSQAGARLAREVGRRLLDRRAAAVRARLDRSRHQAAHARAHRLHDAARRVPAQNAAGLIAGGADALIIETCQDLLQTKAAVIGAHRAMAEAGRDGADHLPRDRGDHRHDAARQRDRRGADRAGAARHRPDRTELRHRPRRDDRAPALPVPARPRFRCRSCRMPACRSSTADGAFYPLTPDELAEALERFVGEYGVSAGRRLLRHDARAHPAVVAAVRGREPRRRAIRADDPAVVVDLPRRAVPAGRQRADGRRADQRQRLQGVPRARCSPATGRRCVEIARSQARDGSHLLDLCVDYVGRDGTAGHARAGRPVRHRLHPADHAGLDRAAA